MSGSGGDGQQPRKPRLLILVDGVFFQDAMRRAGMHYHIDFPRFARMLPSKIDGGCVLVKLRFYIAPSPDPGTRRREQPLFEALEQSSSTELVKGWHDRKECRVCHSPYHREKGTDVAIATALVDGAHRDVYDTALLISGDEDYVAAITAARAVATPAGVNPHFPKRVIWGHFGTQATNGRLAAACDDAFLFDDKLLRTMQRANLNRAHGPYRR
jgi:hypothetical protein